MGDRPLHQPNYQQAEVALLQLLDITTPAYSSTMEGSIALV